MKKINIAELLKDCPKGMELYSPIFGELKFNEVNTINNRILVVQQNDYIAEFESDGRLINCKNGECLLFPSKDQRDWSKFQRPFIDGDIVVCTNKSCTFTAIFKSMRNGSSFYRYGVMYDNEFRCLVNDWSDFNDSCRLATEEEKAKLFDAIKANGYKWNAETKTLEKLVEPKFKVGDRVKHISACTQGIVVKVTDKGYHIDYPKGEGVCYVSFTLEKDYELAPNKFDITTLKPFDKVLVRHNKDNKWCGSFFSHIDGNFHSHCYKYVTIAGKSYPMCIPYEGNEHLLGTTNDCDEYFKNW